MKTGYVQWTYNEEIKQFEILVQTEEGNPRKKLFFMGISRKFQYCKCYHLTGCTCRLDGSYVELIGENLATSLTPCLSSSSYDKWGIWCTLVSKSSRPILGREVHSFVLIMGVATECICKYLCLWKNYIQYMNANPNNDTEAGLTVWGKCIPVPVAPHCD